MKRSTPIRLALIGAVSALALTGTAAAQQQGDMQQQRERMQQHRDQMRSMMQEHMGQGMGQGMGDHMGRMGQDMMGDRQGMMGDRQTMMEQRRMQRQGMTQQNAGQTRQAREQAPMEYQQVRGTITDIRKVRLRGQDQKATLVLLETEQGNRAVVDLGTDVSVRLREGNELSVRGRPITVGDRKVVLQAAAVRYDGRTLDVNRPAMQRYAMAEEQQRRPSARQDQRRQQSSDMQGQNRRQGQTQNQNRTQAQSGDQGLQFSNLDRNGDGAVTRTEFVSRVRQAGQFDRIDRNGDGQVSSQELGNAFYRLWDSNRDGTLAMAEWDSGVDRFFGKGAVELQPTNWDRNGDDRISRREFRQAFAQSGIADQFQGGNGQGLNQRAFYGNMFDAVDTDDDGRLTRSELRQAGLTAGTRTAGAQ